MRRRRLLRLPAHRRLRHPDIKNVAHAGSIGSEIAYNIVVRFGVADSLFVVYEEGGKGLFINGKNDYYLAKDPRGTWIIEMEPNDALIFATYDGCGLGGQGHCVPGTNENTVLSLSFLVVLREQLTLEQFVVGKLRPALTAAAMVEAEEPAQNEITLRCSERAAYMAMMIERAPGKPNPFNFQARSRSEKLEKETAEQAEDFDLSLNEFVWQINAKPSFVAHADAAGRPQCTNQALAEDYGLKSYITLYMYTWWGNVKQGARGGSQVMITSELDDDIKNTCGAEWAEAVVGSSGAHLHTPEKEAERDAASDAAWEVKYRVFAGIVLDKNCRAAAELLRSTQAHTRIPQNASKSSEARSRASPLMAWLRSQETGGGL